MFLDKLRKLYPCNVGQTERKVRIVVGSILIVLAVFEVPPGEYPILAALLGALGVASGIIGHCPVYSIFNANTNK
ncbi:MAG: DUF2892 domain-containing protein [Deltaproteobacteria bacterium]|nr:DUF2892 domain-containing protein [Deltaproteobacteria bacterium]